MPRPEKVQAVADIKERLEDAQAVFVTEYAGLSVKQQQALRRGLRGANSEFKVMKMTLARLAAEELGHEGLLELLTGPTGLAFAHEDAVTSAKVLKDFSGDNEQLVIKGGLLGGEVLTPERVSALADLEPRDVQLAKIAGAFQAPLAALAGLLAALPRNLASAMQQLVEKKESEPGAADEPAAEEAAAAPAEEAAEVPAEDAADEAAPEAAADEAAPEADEADEADEAPAEEAADDAQPEAAEDAAPEAADDAAPEGAEDAVPEAEADEATPEATADDAETDDESETESADEAEEE